MARLWGTCFQPNMEVRKRRGKSGGLISPNVHPFHSHFTSDMKALNSGVCKKGPNLHSKYPLLVGVLPLENEAIMWTACAVKGMWGWSWKHLICLYFYCNWRFMNPCTSHQIVFSPLFGFIAAYTLCPKIKSQDNGGVPPHDVKHLLAWKANLR